MFSFWDASRTVVSVPSGSKEEKGNAFISRWQSIAKEVFGPLKNHRKPLKTL